MSREHAIHAGPGTAWVSPPGQCALCWGARAVWEPSVLGLLPVVCDGCDGTGRAPSP